MIKPFPSADLMNNVLSCNCAEICVVYQPCSNFALFLPPKLNAFLLRSHQSISFCGCVFVCSQTHWDWHRAVAVYLSMNTSQRQETNTGLGSWWSLLLTTTNWQKAKRIYTQVCFFSASYLTSRKSFRPLSTPCSTRHSAWHWMHFDVSSTYMPKVPAWHCLNWHFHALIPI